ncbi:MAG: molybdopterin-guanine dinucleotide biosynthesis protein B [Sulfolobales archaeon]
MDLENLLEKISGRIRCIIQVVGPRDSGKTLLITKLIERLHKVKRDLRVLVIKHTHHKQIDVVDKDTYRFLEADADAAVIISESGFGIFSRRRDLSEFLGGIDVDLIIVEGFKEHSIGFRVELKEPGDVDKMLEEAFRYAEKCLYLV